MLDWQVYAGGAEAPIGLHPELFGVVEESNDEALDRTVVRSDAVDRGQR